MDRIVLGSSHTEQEAQNLQDEEDRAQKNVFVWYACYGSNMLEERFNCYLRGSRVEGMSRDCIGARDKTPASTSIVEWMPYNVFFAYAIESAWGYGGGAMLDVRPNQPRRSCMRLYKVSLQQFNDVIAQENGRVPPLSAEQWLTRERLGHLRQQTPGSLQLQFESGFYPAVGYLGERDELPILTFTCFTEKVTEFLNGKLPAVPPANNYLAVLQRGMVEMGVEESEVEKYWMEIIERQFVM
jgi:histone deacetylase 4/5